MKRNEKLSFVVSEGMKERLANVVVKTGLTRSEIARRGILEQLNKLEGDPNES